MKETIELIRAVLLAAGVEAILVFLLYWIMGDKEEDLSLFVAVCGSGLFFAAVVLWAAGVKFPIF